MYSFELRKIVALVSAISLLGAVSAVSVSADETVESTQLDVELFKTVENTIETDYVYDKE